MKRKLRKDNLKFVKKSNNSNNKKQSDFSNSEKLIDINKLIFQTLIGIFVLIITIVIIDIIYQNNGLDRSILNKIIGIFSTLLGLITLYILQNKDKL